jgi:hypothetical protein
MKAMGRTYPADVTDGIRSVAAELDDLMFSSVDLSTYADVDAASRVSRTNAQLVNDVILASDGIDDPTARERLAEIRRETDAIRTLFEENGVPVHGRPAVPTVEALTSIPSAQAASLAELFNKAYARYPAIVDRYARVRPGLEKKAGLPVAGGAVERDLRALDASFQWLDENVDQVRSAAAMMASRASESPAVDMNRYLFDRVRAWIGAVAQADEAIKRFEALVEGRRAEATPSSGVSWGLVAAGGVLLAALIAVAVTD